MKEALPGVGEGVRSRVCVALAVPVRDPVRPRVGLTIRVGVCVDDSEEVLLRVGVG